MTDLLDRYHRYCVALSGEPRPTAFVDLDALDANIEALFAPARDRGKTVRIATKSIRCADLIRLILERGGEAAWGLMAYSPREARYLVSEGFDDILIAYPTAQAADAELVAAANKAGRHVSIAVDHAQQLALLDSAAAAANAVIPVVVDIDVSLRRALGRVHIGVRRSPLHTAADVVRFVEEIARYRHLKLAGLLGYEAHIAGVADRTSFGALGDRAKQALKRVAEGEVMALRAEILRELEGRGIAIELFNGGGTGSVAFSAADPSLTEVTAGSGFLDSHLFDHYNGLHLQPAAFFALHVSREPAPGYVTCHGGGLVASGSAGVDRLPIPYLPPGLSLLGIEGAGEVQTPLRVPRGLSLSLGDSIIFRHAKAGELAAHFNEYLLVRGERVVGRAKTYRGAGESFH